MIKTGSFILFISLLLLAGSYLFPNDIHGEEQYSESDNSENERNIPELLPFGFIGYFDVEEYILHPNGMVYYIIGGSVNYPYISILYWSELETDILVDNVKFPLNIDPEVDFSRGISTIVGSNGDIHCFIWWVETEQPNRRYDGAIVTIDLNKTGRPVGIEVSMCDIDFKPENMKLFDLDGVPYAYMYHGKELLIFKGGAETAERISLDRVYHEYDILQMFTYGPMIMMFEQTNDGRLLLSEWDQNISLVQQIELDVLPKGMGMDSHLCTLEFKVDLFLFAYLDETYSNIYSDLIFFRISSELQIIDEGKVNLPADAWIRGKFEPMSLLGNIAIMDGAVENILIWDADDNTCSVNEITPLGSIGDLKYGDMEIDIIEYKGEECILLFHDNDVYGTSFIMNRTTFPPLGRIYLEGSWEINDQDLIIERAVTVNGNMTIRDSKLFFSDNGRIDNYGNLTIIDSEVHENSDWSNTLNNYLNLTIMDCNFTTEVTNRDRSSRLLVYGNCFDHIGDDVWINAEGVVHFIGTEFTDLGNNYGDTPLQVSRYDPTLYLIMENCTIERCKRLVNDDVLSWELINCDITSWDPYIYSTSVGFSNLIGTEFKYCDEIVIQKRTTVNYCTFIECEQLQVESGCRIFNCNFISCFEAISDSRSDHRDGDLAIFNSTFDGCEKGIKIDSLDLMISYCSFKEMNRSIIIENSIQRGRYFSISNCSFDDYITAIELEYEIGKDTRVIIENNRFGAGNYSIYLSDSIRPYRKLLNGHGYWDHFEVDGIEYKRFDLTFINARYNTWDSSDPNEVASTLSPFIYFLPYFDMDGNLISTKDNDMDGMSDSWELKMGFDPTRFEDRYFDEDDDHYSNFEEFREGTNPRDNGSNPTMEVRTRLVILEIFFIFIPILVLVCYIYYLQISFETDKRNRFQTRYVKYFIKRTQEERIERIQKEEFQKTEIEKVLEEPVKKRAALPSDLEKDVKE